MRPADASSDPRRAVVSVGPGDLTRLLTTAAAVLVGLSIAGQVLKFVTGHDVAKGFIPMFHVATEGNATTYFSALLLLTAALLLVRIGWQERVEGGRFSRSWFTFAVLFTYLSIDEATALHERLINPVRETLGVGGLLYFAWVIPGFILVVVVGAYLYPLLRSLPRRTVGLFLLGGGIFVGGAIGMELLGGLHYESYGDQTMVYSVLTTIEESMELAGVLVFIHALLLHIRDTAPELRIRLREPSAGIEPSGR